MVTPIRGRVVQYAVAAIAVDAALFARLVLDLCSPSASSSGPHGRTDPGDVVREDSGQRFWRASVLGQLVLRTSAGGEPSIFDRTRARFFSPHADP